MRLDALGEMKNNLFSRRGICKAQIPITAPLPHSFGESSSHDNRKNRFCKPSNQAVGFGLVSGCHAMLQHEYYYRIYYYTNLERTSNHPTVGARMDAHRKERTRPNEWRCLLFPVLTGATLCLCRHAKKGKSPDDRGPRQELACCCVQVHPSGSRVVSTSSLGNSNTKNAPKRIPAGRVVLSSSQLSEFL